MAYVLVARMVAKEGEEGRAAEVIDELGAASREEPGVVHFPEWRPDERLPGPLATWEELLLGGVARKAA